MSAARINLIKARIEAREGKAGYKRNVEALKDELDRLEGRKTNRATPGSKTAS